MTSPFSLPLSLLTQVWEANIDNLALWLMGIVLDRQSGFIGLSHLGRWSILSLLMGGNGMGLEDLGVMMEYIEGMVI